ncbi:MAG: segregation protein B [Flavobacteriaceae bacterium]|nr:segregation protein B [Flavobacteriaceae bacterium]
MKIDHAIVFGATGLIGSHLIALLAQDDEVSKITAVTRREVQSTNPKVKYKKIDFLNTDELQDSIIEGSHVFSAIRTTQAQVKGNKDLYRSIDFDITCKVAEACAENSAELFQFVSSSGADTSSTNFYLKLKGEIEDAVMQTGLISLRIYRPGLLMGQRKEYRFGERIAQFLMPKLTWLLPAAYRPVKALSVATQMLALAKSNTTGKKIIENEEILNFEAQQ